MKTILGFSADPRTDAAVAARVLALAEEHDADRVVMVAHGGMPVTIGHGMGQQLLPGESDADSAARARAMLAGAHGLVTAAEATDGPEGAAVDAVCERFAPEAIVVGTPRHRLVGDLWDAEPVRHARHHCAMVEALHED